MKPLAIIPPAIDHLQALVSLKNSTSFCDFLAIFEHTRTHALYNFSQSIPIICPHDFVRINKKLNERFKLLHHTLGHHFFAGSSQKHGIINKTWGAITRTKQRYNGCENCVLRATLCVQETGGV